MTKTNTNFLKVFSDNAPKLVRPEVKGVRSLSGVISAFQEVTGCELQYIPGSEPNLPNDLTWSTPINPGVGETPGHLGLVSVGSARKSNDRESVERLASSLGSLLEELLQTRHVLWQREAELAAGVPLIPHADEEQLLAARLEAVLKAGVEAVGCYAAGLYMLDEATTVLKLRSSWALSPNCLTEPPRPLRGALADLEALLGHAVVLEDTSIPHWQAPENFASAVCVPIATSTTILGTLWFFSEVRRDFTTQETNIIEVVAGRLAADLEREMLLTEGVQGAQLKQQMGAVQRIQQGSLPTIPPLLDGWDLAGWTEQADTVGGDFFDWFCLPDEQVAAAVGNATGNAVEAALSAGVVKTALRSHAQYQRNPERLLEQVNMTLWTGSAGDQSANLFCGFLDTGSGQIHYSIAGHLGLLLLRPDDWEAPQRSFQPLGKAPEATFPPGTCHLLPGESLLIFTEGLRDTIDRQGRLLGCEGLGKYLAKHHRSSARQLAELARKCLEIHADGTNQADRTVLVLKRTTS